MAKKRNFSKEYISIIENLKKARIESGLKQGDVAKQLGEYSSYLSKIEKLSGELDIIHLLELCLIYNINLKEILPKKYIH